MAVLSTGTVFVSRGLFDRRFCVAVFLSPYVLSKLSTNYTPTPRYYSIIMTTVTSPILRDATNITRNSNVNSVKTDPAATAKGKRSAGGWQDEKKGGWNLFCSALGIHIYQTDEVDDDDDFVQ